MVKPGKQAVIAVEITPQPHPGVAHEHDWRNGVGQNGGESAIDGPTFLCTLGWDWIPAIHDRDAGIWQKAFLSATGPVVVEDPLVTTELPLPRTDSSDVTVQATVENVSDQTVTGVLEGAIEAIHFSHAVELAPHTRQLVSFDAKSTPVLHLEHPRLWWPNGYGSQNLYHLSLDFRIQRTVSDAQSLDFGVRKISYSVPGSDTLTISVNGVPVFIRGGDWGLDEAMKRIPRERLDAEIRMHQLAHMNMIRNWVGQSTGEDFYELCDKYGILVWDEFFQPNPPDGPDPTDIDTYMANARDKVLRFRNHPPSLCGADGMRAIPRRRSMQLCANCWPSWTPLDSISPAPPMAAAFARTDPITGAAPRFFYRITDDYFKTETGSMSVPTLESIRGHDAPQGLGDDRRRLGRARFRQGRAEGRPSILARLPRAMAAIRNLADFVRKAQMANYEAFRAMYEGRNAMLFHPATAVITWMSNPAQPSFVWQLYHYDLEPMSSLFAVMHASELVHIQFNEANGELHVINNLPAPVSDAVARVTIYNLDGSVAYQHDTKVTAQPDVATDLGPVQFPATLSAVHFLKLELLTRKGNLLSSNFYWRALPDHPDDLTALNQLPMVTLEAKAERKDEDGKRLLTIILHNPSNSIALMAHLQLRRHSGQRILPVYYSDNYISLVAE